MKEKKTCDILTEKIMNIWEVCAYSNGHNDRLINDVLENCVLELGEIYMSYDLYLTVYQMTNAHKRILLKKMRIAAERMGIFKQIKKVLT